MTGLIVANENELHTFIFEPIEQTSVRNAMISSVIFVIGFILSTYLMRFEPVRELIKNQPGAKSRS